MKKEVKWSKMKIENSDDGIAIFVTTDEGTISRYHLTNGDLRCIFENLLMEKFNRKTEEEFIYYRAPDSSVDTEENYINDSEYCY